MRDEGREARDTDADALRVQLALLRAATPAARFARQRALSATVIALSRRALARRSPGATPEALELAFLRHAYGDALATRFAAWRHREAKDLQPHSPGDDAQDRRLHPR